MAKKLVARHELEQIVLKELRTQPGCENINSISISRITDSRFETNWSVTALSPDGEQSAAIRYATETTQNELREVYNLFAER